MHYPWLHSRGRTKCEAHTAKALIIILLTANCKALIAEMLQAAAGNDSSICHGMMFTEPVGSFLGINPNTTDDPFELHALSLNQNVTDKIMIFQNGLKLFGSETRNYSITSGPGLLVGFFGHSRSGVYKNLTFTNNTTFKICVSCKSRFNITLVVYNKFTKKASTTICPDEFVRKKRSDVIVSYNLTCVILHNKNMITHHKTALNAEFSPRGLQQLSTKNDVEPGCDSNVGIFGHSSGTDAGWGIAGFFTLGITNSLQISEIEHVTDAIACKIIKTANYTTNALFLLNKEESEIRDHVVEHELALNYLLAHQGGLCNVVKGPMCCSDIDDFSKNVSDMIDKVHEEMKKFYHEPDPFGGLGSIGFFGTLFGHILQWIPIILLTIFMCFICSWVKK
ncbi:glycoprotein [CAS virus]|uniref:Glycoprotein n=1 Tax=CAS virus TaxID=1223561 RepID=J7H5L9_9VIRU|nr:glycoprotein [CAS virus]AFP93551.1 glycoprotein [CAS virus]AKH49230.1 glycoprotein [unidentified Reptarenavirus]AKH49232.1 glycoprotein [unidentified Reptarenavirus]AKH49234.1 glycoprotein [unidentified Reptarenavirus]